MVQWLRFPDSNTEGTGLIPDQETKTPHAVQSSQKKKKKSTWDKIWQALLEWMQQIHEP